MKATIDLTYPKDFPVDGKTVKKHYSKFRKRLRRLGINSLWVLEFQKRGAPHFHLMVDGEIDKELVSKMWFEIVGSGDEKHLKAGTKVQAIKDEGRVIRYISSYMKKLTQKIVPEEFKNVGRFGGYSFSLLEVTEKIIQGSYNDLSRGIRILRRWYKSKLRSWGINWRWKGNGFIVWEGTSPALLLQL